MPFTFKERAKFTMAVTFKVQHEILRGCLGKLLASYRSLSVDHTVLTLALGQPFHSTCSGWKSAINHLSGVEQNLARLPGYLIVLALKS